MKKTHEFQKLYLLIIGLSWKNFYKQRFTVVGNKWKIVCHFDQIPSKVSKSNCDKNIYNKIYVQWKLTPNGILSITNYEQN